MPMMMRACGCVVEEVKNKSLGPFRNWPSGSTLESFHDLIEVKYDI